MSPVSTRGFDRTDHSLPQCTNQCPNLDGEGLSVSLACGAGVSLNRTSASRRGQGVRSGLHCYRYQQPVSFFFRSKIMWERVMKTGLNSTRTAAKRAAVMSAGTVAAAVATILATHSGVARAADED